MITIDKVQEIGLHPLVKKSWMWGGGTYGNFKDYMSIVNLEGVKADFETIEEAILYIKTLGKIEAIKKAIEDADNLKSGLSPEVFANVPALVSLRGRHLYNNLGSLATRYLEVGVHLGGSYCSVTYGNDNIEYAVAIDCFESDNFNERKCQDIFLKNVSKYGKMNILIKGDAFETNLENINESIDMYTYDGDHSEGSQRKALTYYYPILADEFIFVCDDYDWLEVQKGTQDGIKEANLEILFEKYLKGGDHDNDGYWNGYYIALLKKKK